MSLITVVLALILVAAFLFTIFGPSEINEETYRKERADELIKEALKKK